uniref:N-acetyltransferase domain-containing protein n=1 Tax=Ciona savignyi TaxID=51511 RepID=H2ZKJ9_CIOSA
MSHQSDVRIELTTSHEDWVLVRECYVQSFLRYPLYKYMVPDDNKRDAFLRAYLDANYDVTVASGKGILLRIGMPNGDRNNNKSSSGTGCARTSMKIIGGVVFVPPSDNGHGWAITDDEPYWEAYEKYGLAKISPDGLERVKRYEAWENENICKKLSGSRIPMWNGLFCAISPEYSSKGLGSTVYKEAIRIMAQYWVKQQQPKKAQLHRMRPQSERSISLESN